MDFARPGGELSVCDSENLFDNGVLRILQKQMEPHTTQSWQPRAQGKANEKCSRSPTLNTWDPEQISNISQHRLPTPCGNVQV